MDVGKDRDQHAEGLKTRFNRCAQLIDARRSSGRLVLRVLASECARPIPASCGANVKTVFAISAQPRHETW